MARALREPELGVGELFDEVVRVGDRLHAVGVTTTSYTTGQAITFCQGRSIPGWERPMRRSIDTQLRVEHVMASAALPLFFPAIRIGEDWHGDGGIRLHSPLGPPAHLGAGRIIAVSTSHVPSHQEADTPIARGYPSPAQVIGVLYDAIFSICSIRTPCSSSASTG